MYFDQHGAVLNDPKDGTSGLKLMLYNQYIIIFHDQNEETADIKYYFLGIAVDLWGLSSGLKWSQASSIWS